MDNRTPCLHAPGYAQDDTVPHFRPSTIDHAVLSPQRVITIRRLMLTGIVIFAMITVIDYFILHRHPLLAMLIRSALAVVILTAWWLARHARTSIILARWVCVELLALATGVSLSLFFAGTLPTAPLNGLMLIIIISGPAWPNLRYFAAGTLACLLPLLTALVLVKVDAATWYDYAAYLGASVVTAFMLWQQRLRAASASSALRAELERRSVSDALTGILNRAGWNQQAPMALAAADQNEQPVALLYIDLDHFKSINDRHGHAVGDAVIEHAARLIRDEVRGRDLVARLGGEEFAVLLTGNGAVRAPAVAARIRQNFESEGGPVPSTLSVGVAERLPGEDLMALMGRADAALLRAKRNGRNRVEQAVAPD